MRWKKFTLVTFIIFMVSTNYQSAFAESLKFIAPPTHTKQQTKEIYTPIVEYLAKQTGKQIELIYAINFLDYINKMRRGIYDITFDGPHFTSWRIKNLNDTAIARFPGEIKIAIATRSDSDNLNTIDDLIAKRVCAFASPNLLTMAFLNHYKNPLRLPTMTVAKGFKGLEECLRNGKGDAAVLRDKMWLKMNKEGLKLLAIPDIAYPDRTFTTSSRVDATTRDKIKQTLLSSDIKPQLEKLLSTFKKPALISANNDDYVGIDMLLNQIWAFKPRNN